METSADVAYTVLWPLHSPVKMSRSNPYCTLSKLQKCRFYFAVLLIFSLWYCCFQSLCGAYSWTSSGSLCKHFGIFAFPLWLLSMVQQEVWHDHLLKCVWSICSWAPLRSDGMWSYRFSTGPMWRGWHWGLAPSLHCSHAPHSHPGCALWE